MKSLFLMLFFGAATIANAQATREKMELKETPQSRPGFEQSHKFQNAEEMAKGLNISLEEAEKAWAIYTEYQAERKNFNQKKRDSMRSSKLAEEKMTDQVYEKRHRMGFDLRREQINLDEKYYNQLLEVLAASKVHELLKQERYRNYDRSSGKKPAPERSRMQQKD